MEVIIIPKILLGLVLLIFTLSPASGQFYNTRCATNGQCHAHQFLSCYNGYCQCDSRSQVFDHGLSQCVIRPGGKCFFEGGGSPIKRFLKCSKNSVCVSSICQCQPGYGIPKSGEVLCKPNFENSKCKHAGDCDQSKGLSCIHGGCQCTNSSLSYQGMFGCVEASNPEFVRMMSTLKETEKLLKENHVDINAIVDELGLQEASDGVEHRAQPRQLFNTDTNPFGTIDSITDLFTSPQTQNAFNSLGSLFGQGRQGQQAYGVPAGNQGGYGGGSGGGTGTGGYSSGPAQNQTPRFNFPTITNFLNVFNRIIPFLRRLGQLLNPLRFIQRLLTGFRTLAGGLGLGGLRNNNNQGGYGGGGGSSGGYGPPGQGSGGNTGGVRTPSAAYGPPAPASSSINSFSQITPILPPTQQQGQGQQSSTFSNYQTSPPSASNSNFESSPFLNSASNYVPQNNRVPSSGLFANQGNNLQNQNQDNNNNNQQSLFNQNQNNNDDNRSDSPIASASTQSQNKYPRQERNNNNFGDNSSPYLPEHL